MEADTENKEKIAKIFDHGVEAKNLLANQLLSEILADEIEECVEAFKSLPMGAIIDQYQVVHHHFIAINRFKKTLMNKLEAMKREHENIERNKQVDLMEHTNI